MHNIPKMRRMHKAWHISIFFGKYARADWINVRYLGNTIA